MTVKGFKLVLFVAASARIFMQMAAMPPYAGLDEIYHVAYVRFLIDERRPPAMGEESVPAYLASSIAGDPRALPAFGVIASRWPDVVRGRPILRDEIRNARPYTGANYEAQQPSLYYRLASKLSRAPSPLDELRRLRLFSAACALVVVIATAFIGTRLFGNAGLLAAALVVSLPTWQTLVVRASNDALACALIAAALAISLSRPQRGAGWIAEAVIWSAACATKLYAWPIAVVLLAIWRRDRPRFTRIALVCAAIVLSVAVTLVDLRGRTNNPIGLFAFDAPRSNATAVPIEYGAMLKILVASFAWTSGQHGDALRPVAIALYLVPLVALIIWKQRGNRMLMPVAVAIVTFAAAQAVNAAGYIRIARATGVALPAGGKEGWYWYTLIPLLAGILLSFVVAKSSRPLGFLLVAWIVAWDVLITEGALFHDYAGATSPAHPSILFTWGPLFAPFTAALNGIAVGPFVSAIAALRFVHIAAIAALTHYSHSIVDGGFDEMS